MEQQRIDARDRRAGPGPASGATAHDENDGDTTRSGHAASLLRLVLPLAVSLLSEMAMGTTDTALLGGIGPDAVAVGGLSSNLFFWTVAAFQSAVGAAGILMSHSMGAQRPHEVRRHAANALVFGMILCIPCAALLLAERPLLAMLHEPAIIVQQTSAFARILLVSLPPYLLVVGLMRAALPAVGAQGLMLWTMPAMAVVNGVLNASLIHGWLFFPRMGLWGSATASAATGWIVAAVLLGLVWRNPATRPHLRVLARDARPDWRAVVHLARLGLPILFSSSAEIVMFLLTSLRAGRFGAAQLAAHQIALTVSATTFMPSLALSQAINVRVAFWLGAGRPEQVRRAVAVSLGMAVLYTVVCVVFLRMFAGGIAWAYLNPATTDAAKVAALAAILLEIAALYQVLDGLQALFGGALRGVGDTLTPMLMTLAGFIGLGSIAGGWLATRWEMGVVGLWWGLLVGLGSVAALLGARLLARLRRLARAGSGPVRNAA